MDSSRRKDARDLPKKTNGKKSGVWFLYKRFGDYQYTDQRIETKIDQLKQDIAWFKEQLKNPDVVAAGYTEDLYKDYVKLAEMDKETFLQGYSRFALFPTDKYEKIFPQLPTQANKKASRVRNDTEWEIDQAIERLKEQKDKIEDYLGYVRFLKSGEKFHTIAVDKCYKVLEKFYEEYIKKMRRDSLSLVLYSEVTFCYDAAKRSFETWEEKLSPDSLEDAENSIRLFHQKTIEHLDFQEAWSKLKKQIETIRLDYLQDISLDPERFTKEQRGMLSKEYLNYHDKAAKYIEDAKEYNGHRDVKKFAGIMKKEKSKELPKGFKRTREEFEKHSKQLEELQKEYEEIKKYIKNLEYRSELENSLSKVEESLGKPDEHRYSEDDINKLNESIKKAKECLDGKAESDPNISQELKNLTNTYVDILSSKVTWALEEVKKDWIDGQLELEKSKDVIAAIQNLDIYQKFNTTYTTFSKCLEEALRMCLKALGDQDVDVAEAVQVCGGLATGPDVTRRFRQVEKVIKFKESIETMRKVYLLLHGSSILQDCRRSYLSEIIDMPLKNVPGAVAILRNQAVTFEELEKHRMKLEEDLENIKERVQLLVNTEEKDIAGKLYIAKKHNCLEKDSIFTDNKRIEEEKPMNEDHETYINWLVKKLEDLVERNEKLSTNLEKKFEQDSEKFRQGFKSLIEKDFASNVKRLRNYTEIFEDIKSLDYISIYQKKLDYYKRFCRDMNESTSILSQYCSVKEKNDELEKLLIPYYETLASMKDVLESAEEKQEKFVQYCKEHQKIADGMKKYLDICLSNIKASISAAKKYADRNLVSLVDDCDDPDDLNKLVSELGKFREAANIRRHAEELEKAKNIIKFRQENPTAEDIFTKYSTPPEMIKSLRELSDIHYQKMAKERFREENHKNPTEKEFETYYQDYKKRLRERSQTIVQNEDVWVCRQADRALEILEDGRIKSMFETQTTGSKSIKGRTYLQANVELGSIGLPLDLFKEWRPIYLAIGKPARYFGSVAFRVRSEIKPYLFKMMGDSFKLVSKQAKWLAGRFVPFNAQNEDCFPVISYGTPEEKLGAVQDPLDVKNIKEVKPWAEALLVGGAPIDVIRDVAFIRPIDEVLKKKLVRLFTKNDIECHDHYYDLESDLVEEASEMVSHKELNINWVNDHIAVGGSFGKEQIKELKSQGVKLVVDARAEKYDDGRAMKRSGIDLCYLPVTDKEPLSIEQLEEGMDWVNERLKNEERVLIHCEHGIGRSVLLTCAVLVTQGMSAEEALKLVKQKREVAAPNSKQIKRLKEFENIYRAKQSDKEVE